MLHLASSTNNNGYLSALAKTWKKCGLHFKDTPSKSSFSEYRAKVSFKFFEEIFEQQLDKVKSKRKTYRGFHVYAIDGDQLDIAPSRDLVDAGFRGYWGRTKNTETHYLKMYSVQAYDVINGLLSSFKFSEKQNEQGVARTMVEGLEKDSICIYDRAHCGYETILAHEKAQNYFLIRARCGGSGGNIKKEVFEFRKSKKKSTWVIWTPNWYNKSEHMPRVRLVKIRHPETKEIMIFVTNLDESQFTDNEISELYQRRWAIEGAFRDITTILKMEQWHSKKLNGILQEIFALLWLVNTVKSQCFRNVKASKDWLDRTYQKSNFKLCTELFIENIELLIRGKNKRFNDQMLFWIKRSVENREHLSRNYPRVNKRRGRAYPCLNIVPKRR
jgi:hypothetical protein